MAATVTRGELEDSGGCDLGSPESLFASIRPSRRRRAFRGTAGRRRSHPAGLHQRGFCHAAGRGRQSRCRPALDHRQDEPPRQCPARQPASRGVDARPSARAAGLLSDEHFTVDGTQLEAWASLKSFRPRTGPQGPPPDDPGNPTVDFHGERRRNDTHQSTTDPQARLYRKGSGREARPWPIWAMSCSTTGMGSWPTSV